MAILVDTCPLLRAEDLYRFGMPERNAELIEGELVTVTPAGWKHIEISINFFLMFREFCHSHPELHAEPDNTGFLLQRDPDVVLCPDASLFEWRPQAGDAPWIELAPAIAVEVLSPNNTAAEIVYTRNKYFETGSEQVWIADPKTQTLEIYFQDRRRMIVQGNEIVRGEGIAEGMEVDLQKLFKVRTD